MSASQYRRIVAVDPSVTNLGIAQFYFDNTKWCLYKAKLLKLDASWPANLFARVLQVHAVITRYSAEDLLVIETPQTYGGRAAKGDANALIKLGQVVGALTVDALENSATVWQPTPREWNGGAPKEVTKARVEMNLVEEGRAGMHVTGKKFDHNVYDAVGIGLWAVGKLTRTVRIHRSVEDVETVVDGASADTDDSNRREHERLEKILGRRA